jgi:pimeloyl-ACP methyl ester carboxylesterase
LTSYVLIHGGFHGSWCWTDTAAHIRRRGHWAATVDLPGRGDTAHLTAEVTLDDWVAALGAVVDTAPEPPTLVAHSIGATTTNQYAEGHAGKVAGIIYICAVTPRDGDTGASTMLEAGPTSALLREGGFSLGPEKTAVITEACAIEAFYDLCSEADTRYALAHLSPEPMGPLITPLTLGKAFRSLPKAYIAARDDKAMPLDFQIELAGRMGAELALIDGDHSPFYSARSALVDALLRLPASAGRPR